MNEPEKKQVVLKTENLVKNFGNLTAVNKLSLEIFGGEIFGFLGPNGAGKSTSINMICGLLKPSGGQIYFHGKILKSGDKETKQKVGVCPQNIILWQKLTCFEQMVFAAQLYGVDKNTAKNRSEQLLNDMGLSEKRNSLASQLSGGMQRRLNIIMALIHNPEIVIFDEPEAGLDPQSRVLVRDYIKSLSKKKTVILTTHNMDEAERVCDRIAIIDKEFCCSKTLLNNSKIKLVQAMYLNLKLLNMQLFLAKTYKKYFNPLSPKRVLLTIW